MATAASLAMLKADLGYTGAVPEEVSKLMEMHLDAAMGELSKAGIAIDEARPEDLCLLVMYAAWRYRRRSSGDGMPPMVRQAMNDWKVAAATGTEGGV